MIESPLSPLGRADCAKLAAEILRSRPPDWPCLRLAILGSSTTEFLNSFLIVEAARFGVLLEIWNGPYGQIEQQCVDPASDLYRNKPDAVLILPELEGLSPDLAWRYLSLSNHEVERLVRDAADRLKSVVEEIRQKGDPRILLGNLPAPPWKAAGLADPMLENSLEGILGALNGRIARLCRDGSGLVLFDIHGLGCETGWKNWRDHRMAALARAPCSSEALAAIARLAARHFRSWSGAPKKCLVLDMDDTLWGGVLGELGLDGIHLGPDYPGNVFVDFQRRLLALRDRGVLLAVASKNNAADVEAVLSTHPSCLLKREHFSAFEVHWEDKATSLRRIANSLNLGMDSLVFFDDNPVEREWVKSQVPAVAVIDVPKSPLLYWDAIERSLVFDHFTLTDEDRSRARLYQQEEARSLARAEATSLESFIRSLKMVVTLGRFEEAQLPRIVQLLAKTNQFNLTTRRHDEAQLARMLQAGAIGLWARVSDRFGDSGLVALAIAVPETGDDWVVDTFLMSCRVIGRGVETALLAGLEGQVRQCGGRALHGVYLPTARNQPAADFYPRHGYQDSVDPSRWHLCLDEPRPMPETFAVVGLTIDP